MKTSTAKVTEQQSEQVTGYVLGGETLKHIHGFATALKKSNSVASQCVAEAIDVAKSFPQWIKGD